ncbi:copper-binding protein [Pseudomonas sp. NPDC089569]|uniref:copper-binding protein n=1 Tax=Pseudomonas sp. NPDC089569 TaxID=3390722 RepID=UPI003CFE9F34
MKLMQIAVASTLATLSFIALAEEMPGMKMDDMEGMQAEQPATQAPIAKAQGTIKAINLEKHTVTIAHGAVPALQWPAMTMAFFATAQQLEGLSAGDRVTFEFRNEGAKATVVSMAKEK